MTQRLRYNWRRFSEAQPLVADPVELTTDPDRPESSAGQVVWQHGSAEAYPPDIWFWRHALPQGTDLVGQEKMAEREARKAKAKAKTPRAAKSKRRAKSKAHKKKASTKKRL